MLCYSSNVFSWDFMTTKGDVVVGNSKGLKPTSLDIC